MKKKALLPYLASLALAPAALGFQRPGTCVDPRYGPEYAAAARAAENPQAAERVFTGANAARSQAVDAGDQESLPLPATGRPAKAAFAAQPPSRPPARAPDWNNPSVTVPAAFYGGLLGGLVGLGIGALAGGPLLGLAIGAAAGALLFAGLYALMLGAFGQVIGGWLGH